MNKKQNTSLEDLEKNDKQVEKELAEVIEDDNSEQNELSDTEDSECEDSEFEEIDVTDNPLYQVLSAFFETEEGENICDILKEFVEVVRENTKVMTKLIKQRR